MLRLLVKYVTDPRFGEMACDVASMVIGTAIFFPRLTKYLSCTCRDVRLRYRTITSDRFFIPAIAEESLDGTAISKGIAKNQGRFGYGILTYSIRL